MFFDNEGLIRREFVPNGQIVNFGFHIDILKRLRYSISRKKPQKNGKIVCFCVTTMRRVINILRFGNFKIIKTSTIPQAPYTPDIT